MFLNLDSHFDTSFFFFFFFRREIHVLHSPGKGDTIIFRIHHSIGDGVSLASLLLDIAEKKDGKPILLPQPRKNPNPSSLSIFLKPFSYFWNTMIGVIQFFSVLFFADPKSTVKVEKLSF